MGKKLTDRKMIRLRIYSLFFTLYLMSKAVAEKEAIIYDQPYFKGGSRTIDLPEIGDCVEFWNFNLQWTVPLNMLLFNDQAKSIKLSEGVCVRMFEHDCNWAYKARVLDTTPNSTWVSNFALSGFSYIVSGIKRIECPSEAPLVVLYESPGFHGESVSLHELKTVGDCQNLWSPYGYLALISEDLRRFNDKPKSIKILNENVCIRLFEAQCGSFARVQDLTYHSEAVKDLAKVHFTWILSAVQIIECPSQKYPIVLHSNVGFSGDSFTLTGLEKVGDCISLWSPRGYIDHISQDLRRFNDRTVSIQIPPGICVRLYEHNCGVGRTLDATAGDSFLYDIGQRSFRGILTSIELTCVPPPPEPEPTSTTTESLDYTSREDSEDDSFPTAKPNTFTTLSNTLKIIGALRCAKFSDEVVSRGNGIFQFRIKERDSKLVEFYIDLQTTGGFVGLGYTPTPPDATITLSDKTFQKLFTKKTRGVNEYPTRNLQIDGDVTKATQLDNALNTLSTEYADIDILNLPQYCIPDDFAGIDVVNDVEDILYTFQNCVNITDHIVDNTKAVYEIQVLGLDGRDTQTFYLNLKTKPGSIVETWNGTVDIKVSVADVGFVQIIKQKVAPLSVYIQGRLKYTGSRDKLARTQGLHQLLLGTKQIHSSREGCRKVRSRSPGANVRGSPTRKPSFHFSTSTQSSTPEISNGSTIKPEPPTDALKVLGVLKCRKITDRVINAAQGIFQYHVKKSSGGDLSFYFDLKHKPGKIEEGVDARANTVFRIDSEANFVKIFTEKLDGQSAYGLGILKIERDVLASLRLKSAMQIMEEDNGGKKIRIGKGAMYC